MSRYIKSIHKLYKLYYIGSTCVLVTHVADEIHHLENQYKNKKIDIIEYSSATCAGLVLGLPQAIFYPITFLAYCTVKINNFIKK
jgi:hypothetical protein